MTEREMKDALAVMRLNNAQTVVVGSQGTVFLSEQTASNFSDLHDKDRPVRIGEGWFVADRVTQSGPMPTLEGDVVVFHQHQSFRVFSVTANGAQEPDPNVAPIEIWGDRRKAEEAARDWIVNSGSNGRIFWLQNDGAWSIIPAVSPP